MTIHNPELAQQAYRVIAAKIDPEDPAPTFDKALAFLVNAGDKLEEIDNKYITYIYRRYAPNAKKVMSALLEIMSTHQATVANKRILADHGNTTIEAVAALQDFLATQFRDEDTYSADKLRHSAYHIRKNVPPLLKDLADSLDITLTANSFTLER